MKKLSIVLTLVLLAQTPVFADTFCGTVGSTAEGNGTWLRTTHPDLKGVQYIHVIPLNAEADAALPRPGQKTELCLTGRLGLLNLHVVPTNTNLYAYKVE